MDSWNFVMRSATQAERWSIEQGNGPLASDACIVLFYGGEMIGWGDDYGTFQPVSSLGRTAAVKLAAEELLRALSDLAEEIG